MAINVNSYAQQAYVNPFQQRGQDLQTPEQKKPETNRTQPREAAAAGSQETETRNERRADAARSEERSEPARDTRRGGNVDITV